MGAETVATVGYGDIVPQSTVGKILGAFLLLGGLALLSVVTATTASSFIARVQRTTLTDGDSEFLSEVWELSRRVDELVARQSSR